MVNDQELKAGHAPASECNSKQKFECIKIIDKPSIECNRNLCLLIPLLASFYSRSRGDTEPGDMEFALKSATLSSFIRFGVISTIFLVLELSKSRYRKCTDDTPIVCLRLALSPGSWTVPCYIICFHTT